MRHTEGYEIKERNFIFKIESDDNFNYIGSMANEKHTKQFTFSANASVFFILQQMEFMMKLYPRRVNRYIMGRLNLWERLTGSKHCKLFGVDISKYIVTPIKYFKEGENNEK